MRRLAPAVLCLGAALATQVHADGSVLHEYVPDVQPDEAVLAISAGAAEPDAIEYDGEALPAPERSQAEAEPPMTATPGDGRLGELAGQRAPSFRPDRLTELEGSLEYTDTFNPSIAPFKRVTSLDATLLADDGVTPVLGIHDPRRRPVPIEGAQAAPPDARPRDRFWGEVMLDFSHGDSVPLPSVSPESRMLSLRTEPATELAIVRDGADNFFAVARSAPPAGNVFAAFLTDAPRNYFASELPHGPANALASEVPPLDTSIRTRALRFASELGIHPRSDAAAALAALTAHFRAFQESSEPPPDTGDIYLDLARAKKGICRHRAYAFVVTAHALGIPARFVQNEAHSWVEVKLAHIGWMRIDLGGAAHGLTAHGAAERPQYQPAQPDPLPRPAVYEESYSLLGRNVSGVRKPGEAELQGRWVKPDATSGEVQAEGRAAFMSEPARGAPLQQDDAAERAPLTVTLDQRHASVLRGRELHVRGRAADAAGHGVSGLRIEVSLAADDRKERMLLGVGVTREQGVFEGDFGVPPDLAVGEYRLVVITPGDEQHLPAIAE